MNEVEKKEITEMAKIVCKEKACSLEYCNKVEKYPNRYMCLTRNGLKALYNAGYRKVENCNKEIEKLKRAKKMTNRQWLESLSDEDLARRIEHIKRHCDICDYNIAKDCDECSLCYQGIELWLQAEHKE